MVFIRVVINLLFLIYVGLLAFYLFFMPSVTLIVFRFILSFVNLIVAFLLVRNIFRETNLIDFLYGKVNLSNFLSLCILTIAFIVTIIDFPIQGLIILFLTSGDFGKAWGH